MSPHSTKKRSFGAYWRLVIVVALAITLVAPSLPASAQSASSAEQEFIDAVNRERTSRGTARLKVCTELGAVARRHSAAMASTSQLYHNPKLATEVSSWQRVSENVGRGSSVSSLHAALMGSDGHRRNILDKEVTQVGVGVSFGTALYVTQVFRRPATGAVCTPPPPPKAPEPVVALEGDFTGSGKSDVATYDPATGRWVVRPAGDTSSAATWGTFSTRTGWSHHLVGDYNGDGRADVVSYHPGSGNWWVQRSTGRGFVLERWGKFSTRTGWSHHLVGDYNGDGLADVASRHSTSRWWLQQSTRSRFSLQAS